MPYLCGGESGLWSLRFVPCHRSRHWAPEALGASVPGWVWGFLCSGQAELQLCPDRAVTGGEEPETRWFFYGSAGNDNFPASARDVSSAGRTWGVRVLPPRLGRGDFKVFWTIKHKGLEKGLGAQLNVLGQPQSDHTGSGFCFCLCAAGAQEVVYCISLGLPRS